jgi:hypothetical protein
VRAYAVRRQFRTGKMTEREDEWFAAVSRTRLF